jgi:putative DNA primase/helicase
MCSNRTGWHGNSFVLPKQTIRAHGDPEIIYQSADVFQHGLCAKGTVEAWKESVAALCAGNSRLVFAASVALAAPVLNLVSGESGGFHFRGESSVGKTTALLVACSLYGGKEYLLQWRATDNGLEAVCSAHSDLMLALDEIGQMDPSKIGETAYMIANGRGKSRANRSGGARQPFAWRLLFVSTGEIGLGDQVRTSGRKAMAGHEVRVVDVPADAGAGLGMFEDLHGLVDGDAFARYLKECCENHYGTAALHFIKLLVDDVDAAQIQMRLLQTQFLESLAIDDANGQVKRVAGRFALVAAAGELATRYGVTGWQPGEGSNAALACFKAWIAAKGEGRTFEAQSVLSQVRLFFEQHGESRFALMTVAPDASYHLDETRVVSNRAGFRKRSEVGTDFYVMGEVFGQEICKGLDRNAVVKTLIAEGWLRPDKDGKNSIRMKLPEIGQARVYHFTAKMLND